MDVEWLFESRLFSWIIFLYFCTYRFLAISKSVSHLTWEHETRRTQGFKCPTWTRWPPESGHVVHVMYIYILKFIYIKNIDIDPNFYKYSIEIKINAHLTLVITHLNPSNLLHLHNKHTLEPSPHLQMIKWKWKFWFKAILGVSSMENVS